MSESPAPRKRFPWHPSVGFPGSTKNRLMAVLRDGESVASFVREATESAIKAREASRDR